MKTTCYRRLLVVIWIFCSLATGSSRMALATSDSPVCSEPALGPDIVPVWVVRHRFHTGVVFPIDQVPAGMMPELTDFPGQRLVEVGWGDRDFYMASGDDYWLGFKAMVWPTASVLHVVGIDQEVEKEFPFSETATIAMQRPAFHRLVTYIDAAFDREADSRAQALREGIYGNSRFYAAHGSFHLLRTCNVWISQALFAAGCPVSEDGNLRADDVLAEVKAFAFEYRERN